MNTTKAKTCILLAFCIFWINTVQAEVLSNKQLPTKTKSVSIELSDHAAFIIDSKKVTLGEAIRLVLENNRDTLTGAYEVAMSDSQYLKLKGKYSPVFNLEGGTGYQKYPDAVTSLFGIEQKTWDVSSSLSKMFSTGTTISAGIGHLRTEIDWPPQSAYYSPSVFVSLQQELFKNSFGYIDRRYLKINKNMAQMNREYLLFQLSGLVIEAVLDYWTVIINMSALDNAELQLKETIQLRSIMAENVKLGISEEFELNYYNTLVALSESKTMNARQQFSDSLKKLLRTLNIEEVELTGTVVLSDKFPNIDNAQAMTYAYENRADYNNAILNFQNAKMNLQIYKNEGLPSLTAQVNASSSAQRENSNDAYSDISSTKYTEWEARLTLTYPLNDTAQKTNKRDAKYQLEQAKLQVEKYKRLVKDDVSTSIEHINTFFNLYQKTNEARYQSEIYYRKLRNNLKKGRFTSAVVKNGLDTMIESRHAELEALVHYNITLLKFHLAQNALFDQYSIDVDKYLPREK
ncbi:MAG: TolC family protein [Deltaproteobacteria bacterium]|nr:TolC family protein [Deltaproteobacteria bacterium]